MAAAWFADNSQAKELKGGWQACMEHWPPCSSLDKAVSTLPWRMLHQSRCSDLSFRQDISYFLRKSTQSLLKREARCSTFSVQLSLIHSKKKERKAETEHVLQELTAPLPYHKLQDDLDNQWSPPLLCVQPSKHLLCFSDPTWVFPAYLSPHSHSFNTLYFDVRR